MDWLDLTQIFLLVSACFACFNWGKFVGITGTVELFILKKVITEQDLERLKE